MSLPIKLYDLIKEKIGDESFEEKKVVDLILDLADKAEAKEKVQKANSEISTEREKLKEEIKAIKEALTLKEKELETAKANPLSDKDKKEIADLKAKGMTPEYEARFNTLQKQLEDLQNELKSEKESKLTYEKSLKESKRNEQYTALKNKVSNALSQKKILGDNAKLAMSLLETEGMIKLNETDDGTYRETFIVLKDGKPFEVQLDDLVGHIATKHENLVEPSGRTGGGGYMPSNNSNGNFNVPKTLSELQVEAWNNLKT